MPWQWWNAAMHDPIEDYALIGDCHAAALVSRRGSIDWLCWPRFDSGAVFAALLGDAHHGRWLIAPRDDDVRTTRQYVDGSLVLRTEHDTANGTVAVIDFMPLREGAGEPHLVRIVEGLRGQVDMRMQLTLRFDYGHVVPWVTKLEDGGLRAIAGPDLVALRTAVPLHGEDHRTVAHFTVAEGERQTFVLSHGPSHLRLPRPIDALATLHETQAGWERWSRQLRCDLPWRDAVRRSLLTLKALTYAPTGGIIAAPTTSLPEEIGGVRNWDYRYCWLRDASLTLLALMAGGYYDEAAAWRGWLERAVAGSPERLQIMYGIAGERRLDEWTVDWLPGYADSSPVRIGNLAAGQVQHDVYGAVMDALHEARVGGVDRDADGAAWPLQRALVNTLARRWKEPDEGIWENRGGKRHFVHSKVMAWVALDRAVKAIEDHGLDGPLDRWRAQRAQVHDEVCRHGYDAALNSFVQSYGAKVVDASLLQMAIVGFLPADDPRMVGTVAQIERQLLRDGFVLRYDTEAGGGPDGSDQRHDADGLPGDEGAFLACSFWLVDNYVLQGRLDDARTLFERLLALCNDVGLLAEEYDPKARRQVGNFPQAFSHVALVNSAYHLAAALRAEAPKAAADPRHEDAPTTGETLRTTEAQPKEQARATARQSATGSSGASRSDSGDAGAVTSPAPAVRGPAGTEGANAAGDGVTRGPSAGARLQNPPMASKEKPS